MDAPLMLDRVGEMEWTLPQSGKMRVPGRIIADEATIKTLLEDEASQSDWSGLRQVANVACLPGIVEASLALPDVHPGYGFPIGGVAAFDLAEGVAVAGGVGFDINCGVRMLATPLQAQEVAAGLDRVGNAIFDAVPAGLGAQGTFRLTQQELDRLLVEGVSYLLERGIGLEEDAEYIEEGGCVAGADASAVSDRAKQRQFRQVGTLGSGNHYLEMQRVEQILDPEAARAYGLCEGQLVISIHTGSRALGHQIGQDYLKSMSHAVSRYGLQIADRELVAAPIDSDEGRQYLAAVACGANCAFANRQMIAHLVRGALEETLGLKASSIRTVYDIGHNNAKIEHHVVRGQELPLLVHRKGSTRAFGPGRAESPPAYRAVGHPIFVGGTMGTASYVLRGTALGMEKTFGSGIHGAGRAMSRKKAARKFWGETVSQELGESGIRLFAHSMRGVAEEAPPAYKDVDAVVQAAVQSGINVAVARLRPLAVVKG